MFRLEANSTLKNVRLDKSAADGIHIYGSNVKMYDIHWIDIGEDAMTVKAKADGGRRPTL